MVKSIEQNYLSIFPQLIELPICFFILNNKWEIKYYSPTVNKFNITQNELEIIKSNFTLLFEVEERESLLECMNSSSSELGGLELSISSQYKEKNRVNILYFRYFDEDTKEPLMLAFMSHSQWFENLDDKLFNYLNILQVIFNSIATPIYYKDKNDNINGFNCAFNKIFIQFAKNKEFDVADYRLPNFDELFDSLPAVQQRQSLTVEKKILDKDFRIIKSGFNQSENNYSGYLCELIDITGEKQLDESKRLFQSIWENSLDGMRIVDGEGIFVTVNTSYCRMFKKPKEELIGQPFDIVYKDDLHHRLNRFKINYLNNAIVREGEVEIKLWNDEVYWFEFYNSFISFDGKNLVLSVVRDVTKRKLMEKEINRKAWNDELVAIISKNLINVDIYKFDGIVEENLKIWGKFLDLSFIGIFLKKDNIIRLKNKWHNDNMIEGKTFLENTNIFSNLKLFKKLQDNEVIILKREDKDSYNILRSFIDVLDNYSIEVIIILPLIYENQLIGYVGIESNHKDLNSELLDLQYLIIIANIFVNTIKRKELYMFVAGEKEELEVTLKSITNGVITVDKNDTIVSVNSSIETILGYTADELKGKNILFFSSKLFNDPYQKLRAESIKFFDFIRPNVEISGPFNVITKARDYKSINISVNGIKSLKGNLIGYIYVIWDLTERINIEKQMAFTQKMESIGQLAAGIAHEINTPMQFINDNNKFIKDFIETFNKFIYNIEERIINDTNGEECELKEWYDKLKEELDLGYYQNESMNAVNQSQIGIERIINIVKAMKDFAHPTHAQKSMSDINHAIEVTCAISKNEWKYVADIELELSPTKPHAFCRIDEINQVFLNMIVNSVQSIDEAIKLNKIERGLIKIKTEELEEKVSIEICDNGIGIEESNMDKLFDLFFTTKEVGVGTGQGLSIAHDIIVKKHDGTIEVESKYGHGAKFTIFLPKK